MAFKLRLNSDGDAAWSFSKLTSYEDCPKRFYETYLNDEYKETDRKSDKLIEGDLIHKALAEAFTNGTPLPQSYRWLQPFVDKLINGEGELHVEQRYALNRNLQPVRWTARDCWFRGIADWVRVSGPVALAVDWKTGDNVRPDSVQLALMALCVLCHNPDIQVVVTRYEWVSAHCTTEEVYTRDNLKELWPAILERVARFQKAHTTLVDTNDPGIAFPPKPGRLCKRYCPVKSCIYNGK